jgi:arginyl-tRNA synthetase
MLFDPEESIDFNGNTGPFIQYTYARICSIIKRAESLNIKYDNLNIDQIINISDGQKKIINHIYQFPKVIKISSDSFSPSLISQYTYDLSKLFNSFYQEEKIIDGKNNETTSFKIALAQLTSITLKNSLELLGIDVPKKM